MVGIPTDKKKTQADFNIFSAKAGFETKEVDIASYQEQPRADLYFLHEDHLGTGTFVTNSNGTTTQFFLNLPFGETMAEQNQPGDYNNPYKFNAKELDQETGLYYYGARFYDPRVSVWLGVDPLAEKYFSLSPYAYVANNPVRYIDPNGMFFKDFYDTDGNWIGNDGVDDGKKAIALTPTAQTSLIVQTFGFGETVNISESLSKEIINLPTNQEIKAMDDSYVRGEANGMTEQGFVVYNDANGNQMISNHGTGTTSSVPSGANYTDLRGRGITDFVYDAHLHGAVIKVDDKGQIIVGGMGSSAGDRAGGDSRQPRVILGYDVRNNTGNIIADDLSKAQNTPETYFPLSNPNKFNKTINFYNSSGDLIKPMKYSSFKNLVKKIQAY